MSLSLSLSRGAVPRAPNLRREAPTNLPGNPQNWKRIELLSQYRGRGEERRRETIIRSSLSLATLHPLYAREDIYIYIEERARERERESVCLACSFFFFFFFFHFFTGEVLPFFCSPTARYLSFFEEDC